MMMLLYAWRLVTRNPRRSATYLFGLALAVGLFAGILFFVDAMARQMTMTALAPVKLDLIAHATQPTVNVLTAAPQIATQHGIRAAEPVTAADFASAQKVGGTQTSPMGRLFAIAPSYLKTFDLLQVSQGQFDTHGALVSEAMAVSQNLRVGDSLQLTFAGIEKPVTLPVTGIVDLSNADALFSTTNEAENAVVADVVFVDQTWFAANLQTQLAALAATPPPTIAPGIIILDQQVHVKIDRAQLPADPILAALQNEALRRSVERQFSGQLKAVDNLARAFKTAQADVLAAKILFIFLGLPGVALAAYLAKFAAELFADAQRRELSLLRTRGTAPAQLITIVAFSSLLLAIGGSILGLGFGIVALLVSGNNPFTQNFDWSLFASSAGIAFVAGLVLTFLAAFLPTFSALQREITQERRAQQRVVRAPFWKRAYLDFILLGAAMVVLVVTQINGGFKPSGNEGTVLSLSFYIFLAPLFAWLGLTLLTLRLVERGLAASSKQIAFLFRGVFGEIGEVAGKSIARRAARLSAATTVIALTLSFGVSLALFQQTYTNEKRLDAQYIVGSDIRLTPALNAAQAADLETKLAQTNGVVHVTGVARDTQALVGSEKNTVYGIDVPSFRQTAYLPDSFFVDGAAQQTIDAMTNRTTNYAPGSAKQVLDALANTPNGVIISVEQAEKYNIQVGDPVLLRLFNRKTGTYTDTQAQAVGLFIYLPTSAQDSDFILNRAFMQAQSGNSATDYFLAKTDGNAETIASASDALAAQFKNVLPVRIQNTETVIKTEESSLTALNLGGLGAMERLYTLLVISVGLAIFLLAMINERQREFGSMRALGANLNHLRKFLFAEAATIGSLSIIIGVSVGILLAWLLVMLLSVIFTIPAQRVALPGAELAGLVILVIVGMLCSTYLSARRLASMKVVEALREL